jgi:hypothetical protein
MLSVDIETVKLTLCLKKGRNFPIWQNPHYQKNIQEELINDDTKLVIVELDIDPTIDTLEINNIGKNSKETIVDASGKILKDQIFEIQDVLVNDIKLENWFVKENSQFVPRYESSTIEYAQKHDINLPEQEKTLQLFNNGTWTFRFERPFFHWYNKLMVESIEGISTSIWIKQSHLGLASEDMLDRLDNLLEKL